MQSDHFVDRQVPGLVALLGTVALLLAFASTGASGQMLTARALGLLGLALCTGAILLLGRQVPDHV